ncbi:stress response translation initiation inhibitor YciH [Candidatus Micrarchaeota archaeon]|nr:stress response translation initiation inhibitor YciH [Candidatus Micrarchaeota archaeon]
MPEICPKCGLPKDLCVCDILEKEEVQRIRVYTTRKKFRKLVTIIEGINKENLTKTAKELKQRLACGGTAKDGLIILQGDQTRLIKKALVDLGYPEESITVERR